MRKYNVNEHHEIIVIQNNYAASLEFGLRIVSELPFTFGPAKFTVHDRRLKFAFVASNFFLELSINLGINRRRSLPPVLPHINFLKEEILSFP